MPLSFPCTRLEVSKEPQSADAAWIPLAELADRMAELPPKNEVIHLVESGDYEQAQSLLETFGRRVKWVPPLPGSLTAGRLWRPNPFLETCLGALPPGEALELACGGGREAVALAGAGWRVTAVDILEDGLERARLLAERHLPSSEAEQIDWRCIDLEKDGLPAGPWDLVTMFFFLDRDLLVRIPSSLRKGGSLILETFLEEHGQVYGKPRSSARLLKSGELPGLFPNAEIVRYEEGLCRERITARGWFRF